jgi:hypothetical protein
MLILVLLAALVAEQPAPPAKPADRSSQKSEREIMARQLASRSAGTRPMPAESGTEAAIVEAQYLKSIGRQLQPPNDSLQGSSNSSGAPSR